MIYDRIRSWIAGSFNTPITYTAGELVIKEPYTKVLQTHVNSGQLDWAPDQPNSMYYLLQQSSVRLVLKYNKGYFTGCSAIDTVAMEYIVIRIIYFTYGIFSIFVDGDVW